MSNIEAQTRSFPIPFAGFYESIHDACFDTVLELEAENGRDLGLTYSEEDLFNAVNWKQAHEAYAKSYAENFGAWVKQETGFDLRLTYESLDSPRFYNFETDKIFVTIPFEVLESIRAQTSFDTLKTVIEDRHTSRSGFYSFYSPDISEWLTHALSDWDNVRLETLFIAWLTDKVDCDCQNSEIDDKIIGFDPYMAQSAIDGATDWASIGR